jgi:hypothetical protein
MEGDGMNIGLTKIAPFLTTAILLAGQTPVKMATPLEPVAAIVDAFRSHPIVAIGNVEFSGNQQCHAFYQALLRSPKFTAVVNDIVVEFGNSMYQGVMDRFIRGEEVPYEELRQAWQNTTQVEYEWDLPIYEEFFATVRKVNASLPASRRLRVLLGDPPINWARVHTLDDLHKGMGDRDGTAVEVLRREVLAKGRRALVIYGSQHLLRKNTTLGATDEWAAGIVARLEKDGTARVFTIFPGTRRDLTTVQPDIGSWPVPSLARLPGTTLGSVILQPDPRRRPVRLEEQFDAILYLGPPSSMTAAKLSPALCRDRAYMEMRLRRLQLVPPPPGASVSPAEQLKSYCASQK